MKEELENHYTKPDPWGYRTNPDDLRRKNIIIAVCTMFQPEVQNFYDDEARQEYDRVLDIGCGEGWITADLPGWAVEGYELSDKAAARIPYPVKRTIKPDGKYDLVVATGIMYVHYDYPTFLHLIKEHADQYVLTCNIKAWEVPAVKEIGKQIFEAEFPYREFTQKLRVFDVRQK